MISPKLKVIIADRSPFSRLVLTAMVQAQPDLEVVDTATDSFALVEVLHQNQPDVLVADLGGMSQTMILRLLRQLNCSSKVPVLALLDQDQKSFFRYNEEAKLGVYDYVFKPDHKLQSQLRSIQMELLEKIRASRQVTCVPVFSAPNATVLLPKTKPVVNLPAKLIVIGASTGGIPAIEQIVAGLTDNLNACILIAVHLPAGFTRSLARRLQTLTALKVVEGRLGTRLAPNQIIIAPGSRNMTVMQGIWPDNGLRVNFITQVADEFDRPSVDLLMKSVAGYCGRNTLGILLTGMGNDGTEGLKAIKLSGGTTLAQDQASSVVFGMARSAIRQGTVQHIRKLSSIPAFINQFVAAVTAPDQQSC